MSNTRKTETIREPLIHLSKREGISPVKAWVIRIIAVLAGLAVCGLIAFLLIDRLKDNPGKIGDFYYAFVKGSFATSHKFWKFLKNVAILLCISLALTPAFRMRFWNIGGEGLLMHKQEINRLYGKVKQDGYSIIPLSVYLKDSRVKVEIALCRGKKLYDKRDDAAVRDAKRQIDRAMKERNH